MAYHVNLLLPFEKKNEYKTPVSAYQKKIGRQFKSNFI